MFPIRDHNPATRTPWVTRSLIAVNVAVFLAMLPAFADPEALMQVMVDYALWPGLVTRGEHLSGLFTHMFMHGSFMHLLGNMLFLWIFGDNLEDALGHAGFALFYLVSGLGAAALQIAAAPDAMIPMVGASGAIAGVMGGYLLLFPRARVDVLFFFLFFVQIIPLPAWMMLIYWLVIQVLSGAATPLDGGGVAYWAHTGGFIVGFLWVLPVWLKRGGPDFWTRTQGHPPHPETRYRTGRSHIPRVPRRRR